MSKNYCMIIGDMIASKSIPPDDRKMIQENLKIELENINYDYDYTICSRFSVTLGDEFQGGLINTIHLFEIIDRIKKSISPYKMRFGIGIGDLRTYVKFDTSLESDGPGYYYARKALDDLKEKKECEYGYRIYTGQKVELINPLFDTLDTIAGSWTDSQKKYVDMMNNTNQDMQKVAGHLGISVSTLSRTLTRANYKLVKSTFEKISDYLFETYDLSEKQDSNRVLYNRAYKGFVQGEYGKTIDLLKKTDTLDETDRMNCLLLLSACATILGDKENAIRYATQSLSYITPDYTYKKIRLLNILGINQTKSKKYKEAEVSFEKARDLIENKTYSKIWNVYTLGNQANLSSTLKNYDTAEEQYLQMLGILRNYNNQRLTEIKVLSNLGNIYYEMGKYSEAQKRLQEAMEMAEIYLRKDHRSYANLKLRMGKVLIETCGENDLDNQEKIDKLLNEALKIFEKMNYHEGKKETLETLKNFYEKNSNWLEVRYYTNRLLECTNEVIE